jgi:hypothetical protein
MYRRISRMSSSVIMARTLMWRMAAAITRGGNLCGGWWQRPQLTRNLFSPSNRRARPSDASGAAWDLAEVWVNAEAVGGSCAGAGTAAVDEPPELARSCATAEKVKHSVAQINQNRI